MRAFACPRVCSCLRRYGNLQYTRLGGAPFLQFWLRPDLIAKSDDLYAEIIAMVAAFVLAEKTEPWGTGPITRFPVLCSGEGGRRHLLGWGLALLHSG